MCSIFSSINPQDYAFQTRSVRLGGHATSVRLEALYWTLLEEVAAMQGVALGRFLSKLHDEALGIDNEPHNFASLLRCACLTYALEVRGKADAARQLQAAALADFARQHGESLPRARAPASNHETC